MNNTTTFNPITVNNYGTQEERQKSINKKSFKDYISFASIVTLICVFIDTVKLYTTWDTVQTETWWIVLLFAFGFAIALDVPMLLIGNAIKEYEQGLRSKKSLLKSAVSGVSCFFIAFAVSLWFSLVTKDATFQPATSGIASNMTTAAGTLTTGVGENKESVFVAAFSAGILPLLTSIASFTISILTANPLGDKIRKIDNAKLKAQNHLMVLEEAIAEEEESLPNRLETLLARENDLFNQFKGECMDQEQIRLQAFREALMEKCDADGITQITESAFEALDNQDFKDTAYGETLKVLIGGGSGEKKERNN